MDDVQSLRQQVKKLQRRLDQIEGVKNEKVVAELTGVGDEPKGFHTACVESGARVHAEQRAKLVARLNASGGYVTESDLDQLRWGFRSVADVEALLANKAAGRRIE